VDIRPGVPKASVFEAGDVRFFLNYKDVQTTMSDAAIFIDGGYLEKVLQEEFSSPRISHERLSLELARLVKPDTEVLRTYYYHSPPYQGSPPTDDEKHRYDSKQRFFAYLQKLPRYEVRLGRLSRRKTDQGYKYEQKMVDALLSIDIVKLSAKGKIKYAILVAGDGDFVPAIKVAKEESVVVCLFHGPTYHRELWEVADERRRITKSLIDSVSI
jgi:uncharacterized LabA/DUF88 family protein